MAIAIWKDKFIDFGTVQSVDFSVSCDGETIFSGHAVRRPGESNLKVRVNDICSDHLVSVLPDGNGIWKDGCAKTFHVWNGDTLVESVTFVKDWSYDTEQSGYGFESLPVQRKVSPYQPLLFSKYEASDLTVTLAFRNGTTSTVTLLSHLDGSGQMGVGYLDLTNYQNLVSVTVDGHVYEVTEGCERYCLAYVNPYGGWDTLLVGGSATESQNYERTSFLSDSGKKVLANRVTVAHALRTEWLTDLESSRMQYLASSNEVYLLDLWNGFILPVVVTDSSHTVQTYRGNGGKLVQYTVNVELAEERMTR